MSDLEIAIAIMATGVAAFLAFSGALLLFTRRRK